MPATYGLQDFLGSTILKSKKKQMPLDSITYLI
jgi:hypothetical protein